MTEQQDTIPIDRIANFRGEIIEYHGVEGRGGSYNIAIRVLITGEWDEAEESWSDVRVDDRGTLYSIREYFEHADGLLCVIKKDGTVNETATRGLIEHAGWNGSMMSVWDHSWQPDPVSFTLEEDEYRGKKTIKIGFINGFDEAPGGKGNMTEEKAKAFDSRFGPQLRALVGNNARNAAPPPSGKPAAPKGPAGPARPAAGGPKRPGKGPARTANARADKAAEENGDQEQGESIPF